VFESSKSANLPQQKLGQKKLKYFADLDDTSVVTLVCYVWPWTT